MTEKETNMETDRDLGDFWKVQAQLAQTLQLDIARTLHARRVDGTPTGTKELQDMAQALLRCGEVYDVAAWRQENPREVE